MYYPNLSTFTHYIFADAVILLSCEPFKGLTRSCHNGWKGDKNKPYFHFWTIVKETQINFFNNRGSLVQDGVQFKKTNNQIFRPFFMPFRIKECFKGS